LALGRIREHRFRTSLNVAMIDIDHFNWSTKPAAR
jgi:hypothetical protein